MWVRGSEEMDKYDQYDGGRFVNNVHVVIHTISLPQAKKFTDIPIHTD